jgi:hypothetical protein
MELVTPEALGLDGGQLDRISEHLRRQYVDPGKLPGGITLVARHGQVCLLDIIGQRDLERGTPMTADTIFRIYSMSKPITSVAMMTLFERGLFALDDPVHRFIPSWRPLAVRKAGAFPLFETVPCERPMTIRDLLRLDVAKELTFSGRIVSGEEACQLGLVTRISVDPLADALAMAREIAGRSPDAIRAAKHLLEASWHADAPTGLGLEARLQSALIGSPNQVEAIRANFEKRPPVFVDPAA